jgi:hypothetical protein
MASRKRARPKTEIALINFDPRDAANHAALDGLLSFLREQGIKVNMIPRTKGTFLYVAWKHSNYAMAAVDRMLFARFGFEIREGDFNPEMSDQERWGEPISADEFERGHKK